MHEETAAFARGGNWQLHDLLCLPAPQMTAGVGLLYEEPLCSHLAAGRHRAEHLPVSRHPLSAGRPGGAELVRGPRFVLAFRGGREVLPASASYVD